MKRITEEEVRNYFLQNGNEIISKNKVRIRVGLSPEILNQVQNSAKANNDYFTIEYLLEEKDWDSGRYEKYELWDEVRGVKEFIEAYQIGSIEDLQHLSRSLIWLRYLAEKAEVIFTNGDENSVHFRLFRGRTTVYSINLNWYNEVYKVLNMTEHFKEFVDEHWDEIEGMSYKR
jgi:hypothetical protein